jgi:hypothetical protein
MPSVGIDRSYAWLLPACLWLWAAHAANQTLPRCSQAKRGKIKQERWRNSIRNGRRETAHAGCELGHDTQQIDDAPCMHVMISFHLHLALSLHALASFATHLPFLSRFQDICGYLSGLWTGSEAPTHTHSRGLDR